MDNQSQDNRVEVADLSAKEYAAIQLKVPNSGTPWLDKMITQSLRNDFAGQALVAASLDDPDGESYTPKQHAEWAYSIADAMLEARKK